MTDLDTNGGSALADFGSNYNSFTSLNEAAEEATDFSPGKRQSRFQGRDRLLEDIAEFNAIVTEEGGEGFEPESWDFSNPEALDQQLESYVGARSLQLQAHFEANREDIIRDIPSDDLVRDTINYKPVESGARAFNGEIYNLHKDYYDFTQLVVKAQNGDREAAEALGPMANDHARVSIQRQTSEEATKTIETLKKSIAKKHPDIKEEDVERLAAQYAGAFGYVARINERVRLPREEDLIKEMIDEKKAAFNEKFENYGRNVEYARAALNATIDEAGVGRALPLIAKYIPSEEGN